MTALSPFWFATSHWLALSILEHLLAIYLFGHSYYWQAWPKLFESLFLHFHIPLVAFEFIVTKVAHHAQDNTRVHYTHKELLTLQFFSFAIVVTNGMLLYTAWDEWHGYQDSSVYIQRAAIVTATMLLSVVRLALALMAKQTDELITTSPQTLTDKFVTDKGIVHVPTAQPMFMRPRRREYAS